MWAEQDLKRCTMTYSEKHSFLFIEEFLKDARMDKGQNHAFVLGQNSKFCECYNFFEGTSLNLPINPDVAVADGVAVQEAVFTGESWF